MERQIRMENTMKISLYTNKQYELTPERLKARIGFLNNELSYVSTWHPSFTKERLDEINHLTNFAKQMGWKISGDKPETL